jgi:SAM-dependent methyltransferase
MTAPPAKPAGASYDQLPYTSHAYAESHPDRLAVVARLSGWNAPSLRGATVLEVGSGRGGNLLAMAMSLPQSRLVGIERSVRQAAEARTIGERLGVTNVTVLAASFGDDGLLEAVREGAFDFVIAHGVASWMAPQERTLLLRRMARWLTPGGVGYVSFNVLPGWYARLSSRDWLRFASEQGANGKDELLASLRWLRQAVSSEHPSYRTDLEAVETRLLETDPAYLAHEFLEGENHPVLVADFLREAEEAGLAYLGDAIPASVALETLPAQVRERARGLGAREAQQLVDFVRCTAFRRALFVRQDTCDALAWRWPARLDVDAVRSLRIASRLKPTRASGGKPDDLGQLQGQFQGQFQGPAASVQIPVPLTQAALLELHEVAPRALAFEDLLGRAKRRLGDGPETRIDLRSELLELWLSVDGIDLHDFDAPFEAAVSEKPEACPLARFQAQANEPITNRWHQEVVLAEPVVKEVLLRADGTRTIAEIARAVTGTATAATTTTTATADEDLVLACLLLLAKSALLVA